MKFPREFARKGAKTKKWGIETVLDYPLGLIEPG
jgi:hypothetical protein